MTALKNLYRLSKIKSNKERNMGLFDTIKNALVEDDAPHVTPVAKKVETNYAPTPQTTQKTYSSPAQTPLSSGKMKDILLNGLTSNLSGSPYINFQNMNSKMKPKIADTSTRLAAISASMEVQGIEHIRKVSLTI
jgi:hypothetical protein